MLSDIVHLRMYETFEQHHEKSNNMTSVQSTVMILSFRTDRSGQTVETQIRLLLESPLFAIPFASF